MMNLNIVLLFILYLCVGNLSAQDLTFENPGFDLNDCMEPCGSEMDCVPGWYSYIGTPTIQCEGVCNANNTLIIGGGSGGADSYAATKNPALGLASNAMIAVSLDLFIRENSDLGAANLSIFGTQESMNTGAGLTLLGKYEFVDENSEEWLNVKIALQPNVGNFEYLVFIFGQQPDGATALLDNISMESCADPVTFNFTKKEDCSGLCFTLSDNCGITRTAQDLEHPNHIEGFSYFISINNGEEFVPFLPLENGQIEYCLDLPMGTYTITAIIAFSNKLLEQGDPLFISQSISVNETIVLDGAHCCEDILANFITITPPKSHVYFVSQARTSSECSIVSSSWDLGDGSTRTFDGPAPLFFDHTYEFCGDYEVCQTIIDDCHCSATYCWPVSIIFECEEDLCANSLLNADFYPIPLANNAFYFYNLSNANAPNCAMTKATWDYGDGSPKETFTKGVPVPGSSNNFHLTNHKYEACGEYEVCLTIEDDCCCSSTSCQTILIGPKENKVEIKQVNCPGATDECALCYAVDGFFDEPSCLNWNVSFIQPNGETFTRQDDSPTIQLPSNLMDATLVEVCLEFCDVVCGTYETCIDFEYDCDIIIPKPLPLIPTIQAEGTHFIFPNPAEDVIRLKNLTGAIKSAIIINSAGKISKQVSNSEIENKEIKVANLMPGNYYLRLDFFDGNTQTEKFIKI